MTMQSDARRALRRIAAAVRAAAPAAVDDGLDVLRREVANRAPVGATGELRRSVATEPAAARRDRVEGSVVIASDHAAAVEFGTSDTPAQPYARPAVDEGRGRIVKAVAKRLERGLR